MDTDAADTSPVRGATAADLDPDLVRAYLTARDREAGRVPPAADSDWTARLTELGYGAGQGPSWQPTVAGLLLFGRAPHLLLPQAQVKAARFRGRDVSGLIVDRAELGGPIPLLVEAAAAFVARNMRVGGAIAGLYRQDTPEYPLPAVREAITNAIAHRDYKLAGQKVLLRMFDDRLEVESPGGLAGPVTLETLETRRYSRNPRLAQAMYSLRLIEEMGTGIRRIRHELSLLGSGTPTFASDKVSFLAMLPALPLEDAVSASVAAAPPAGTAAPPPPSAADAEEERARRTRRATWLRAGVSPRQAAGLEQAHTEGRLTNRDYRTLHGDLSDEAARLDLADLVDRGYLVRIGSNKGTYYILRD
jgi:ATP-dependent DNA helicase RecG